MKWGSTAAHSNKASLKGNLYRPKIRRGPRGSEKGVRGLRDTWGEERGGKKCPLGDTKQNVLNSGFWSSRIKGPVSVGSTTDTRTQDGG